MKSRQISVSSDGLLISGGILLPESPSPRRLPALVLCHGIPSGIPTPADRSYAVLAERFCHAGFATAMFNFRGTGHSEGNIDLPGWTRDLRAIIDYLWTSTEVDRNRIYVFGSSAGAAVAVQVASDDPRIGALVRWPVRPSLVSWSVRTGSPSFLRVSEPEVSSGAPTSPAPSRNGEGASWR